MDPTMLCYNYQTNNQLKVLQRTLRDTQVYEKQKKKKAKKKKTKKKKH